VGNPGGVNLGTATAYIRVDASGISSGLRAAQSQLQGITGSLGASLNNLGDQMTRLGTSLAGLSAPIIGFGVTGIRAAADFDQLLTQIRVFGELAPDELERVRQYALQMGADTKFSSSDAAAALLDLMKAGMDLEGAMSSLPAVLNLAAAGEMSLEQAAGITTTALAQFGLQAEDAGRVADALARAANASRADVADLGMALGNVGPVASQFGLSIEDTAAILGVFSNAGIEGAEAGTQLRSMLLNLNRDTEAVQGAWAELGVSLYDSQGNMRDFNTVIRELDAALDQLPMEDQNRLMQDLAGSYGITGLTALRAAGGIDAMSAAMAESPAAAELAAAFMNTFSGRVESLMGSIETFQIQVLTPFMNNVLAPLVGWLTEVINKFTEWAMANPDLANTIIAVMAAVAAAGPVLVALGAVVSAIGTIIAGLPLAALIATVGAVGAAFATNFGGIRDMVMPFLNRLWIALQQAGRAFGSFTDVINEGGTVIEAAIAVVEGVLRNFLISMGLIDGSQWEQFQASVETALLRVVDVFRTAWDFIANTVFPALQQAAEGFFTQTLPLLIDFAVNTVFPLLVQGFNFIVGIMRDVVIPALVAFGDWFTNVGLPAVITFIETVALPALQNFLGFIGNAWTTIQPALQAIYDWFVTTAMPAITSFVTDVALPAIQRLFEFIANAWTTIQPTLQAVYDWFVTSAVPAITSMVNDTLIPAVQDVIDTIAGIWESIRPALESVYNWFVTEALPAILDFITTTVIPGIEDLIYWFQQIWEAVAPVIQGLVDWFITTGWPVIQSAIETVIIPIVEDVIDTLTNIWETVAPYLQLFLDWWQTNGWPFIETQLNGAKTLVQGFIDLLSGIWTSVQPHLQSFQDGVRNVFRFVMDNVITPFINLVRDALNVIAGLAGAAGSALSGATNQANNLKNNNLSGGPKNNTGGGGGGRSGSGSMPLRDSGGVGRKMLPYLIGPSQTDKEVFIPRSEGMFVPNMIDAIRTTVAQEMRSQGGQGGGETIIVNILPELLKTMPDAKANGEAFGKALAAERRKRAMK
jgi:TP901 family phage tail tape measure protein